MEEADYEGFSIREYTRKVRSGDIRKCCPFPGEFTGDFIQSLLPPLIVTKFRWWCHELTSLLSKSPDDPKPPFRPCKKRSIGETTTNDIVLHKKKIKTFDAKTDNNKVYNCEQQAQERSEDDGECSLGIKERSGVMSPSMNKAGVRCFSYSEEEELFPDSPRSFSQDCDSELQIPKTSKVASIDASQCERQVKFSLQLCCSQMNRLSLCSEAEDQSLKVMSNDQTSDNMLLESRKLNKIQPVVSERRLSHGRAESGLSCFPGPHLTLERIKDALDLERKRHLAQPNQSSISRSSSGQKHLTEPALARDVRRFPVHNEKHHMYFPARLGLDEMFTENESFLSDTNDGECGQAANSDGLCLHNTQSTMRLMGKNVSIKTGYSDMVRKGERIIDYSFLESYAQQSWLWQTRTLGETYSFTSLDKSWNTTLLCDTPFPMFCEPPQVRTYVVPDSELLPPTISYPCGSLVSCPLTGKDLYFHESGLGQQQLPFPSTPEIAGLLPDDAREPSFGLPFTPTTQSQLHWPQSSF